MDMIDFNKQKEEKKQKRIDEIEKEMKENRAYLDTFNTDSLFAPVDKENPNEMQLNYFENAFEDYRDARYKQSCLKKELRELTAPPKRFVNLAGVSDEELDSLINDIESELISLKKIIREADLKEITERLQKEIQKLLKEGKNEEAKKVGEDEPFIIAKQKAIPLQDDLNRLKEEKKRRELI